jgi:flagella basal body P-ring formation protein FlgA
VSLASTASASTDAVVRSGQAVNVIFHKGPITIEMPGKTLAAAGIGEQVKVLLTDSQKSFTGYLREGKAVDVELP